MNIYHVEGERLYYLVIYYGDEWECDTWRSLPRTETIALYSHGRPWALFEGSMCIMTSNSALQEALTKAKQYGEHGK